MPQRYAAGHRVGAGGHANHAFFRAGRSRQSGRGARSRSICSSVRATCRPRPVVLLNNTMDDFSVKPGRTQRVRLGWAMRRTPLHPTSAVCPAWPRVSWRRRRALMIIGTPGGAATSSAWWLQGDARLFGMAYERRRHRQRPATITINICPTSSTTKKGAPVRRPRDRKSCRPWATKLEGRQPAVGANMEVITWDYATGKVEAASDPRGEGEGTGVLVAVCGLFRECRRCKARRIAGDFQR